MRKSFEERRNYIVERMNSIPGVSCIKPEGAFYVMMNLEQLIGKTIHGVEITNDDVFADAFLKYGLVAVVDVYKRQTVHRPQLLVSQPRFTLT